MTPYILSLLPMVFFLNWKTNNQSYKRALIIWFLVLVILAGLRGDFTADFTGYRNIFLNYKGYDWSRILKIINIKYHFDGWELGYVFQNFLISRFTDDYMWVQIITAMISYGCIFAFIYKSRSPIISILLFMSVGIFLEGFNTVRGVMAACICSLSINYITKKDFKKYLLIIFIASLFHTISIVMIPFYFVLDKKPNVKMIFFYAIGSGIVLVAINYIAVFLNTIFGFAISQNDILHMLYRHHYSFGAIFFAVIFSLFSLFIYYCKPNYYSGAESREEMILANGVIIWVILHFFMMLFGYAERFAEFFSVYILLFLPMQLQKFETKSRWILKISMAVVLVGYYLYASRSMYGPYRSIL